MQTALRIRLCRRRDVEGTLIGGSDVHEVAERAVSLVLGPLSPSTESAQTPATDPSAMVTSQCCGGPNA